MFQFLIETRANRQASLLRILCTVRWLLICLRSPPLPLEALGLGLNLLAGSTRPPVCSLALARGLKRKERLGGTNCRSNHEPYDCCLALWALSPPSPADWIESLLSASRNADPADRGHSPLIWENEQCIPRVSSVAANSVARCRRAHSGYRPVTACHCLCSNDAA